MSALRSVQLAIEVATGKRDQAGKLLLQVQQAHLFAQDQLAQLEGYAQESEAKWAANAQVSTSPELMRHHYQFMGRLHQAISLQQGVLHNSAHKMEQAKQVLLEAEFRLVGLKQVLKKKQTDLAKLQSRREQKQMDEMAALRSRSGDAALFSGERS